MLMPFYSPVNQIRPQHAFEILPTSFPRWYRYLVIQLSHKSHWHLPTAEAARMKEAGPKWPSAEAYITCGFWMIRYA